MRFLVWFASIFVIATAACSGGDSSEFASLLNFIHAVDTKNAVNIEREKILSDRWSYKWNSGGTSISKCTTLVQLNLSRNDLRGKVSFAIMKLKRVRRLDLSQEEEEEETGHHESSLQTWQVWTLFLLGVLFLFLVVFFLKYYWSAFKIRKHDRSPSRSSPTKDAEEVVMKAEERRSELVFFVEQEEWFKLEDLLEGVADLRTHGFGSSLYVVRLKNGAVYAVKRLRKLKVSFQEFGLTMTRVGNLRHPNILPLVSYNNTLHEKLLIYRFQTNGSLLNLFENYAQGKRAFPWKLRLSIAVGIARGLDFIYRNLDIIPHGVIKLSNIMLSDDEEPLISEYGYAKFVSPTGPCLSMKGYTAPEKTLTEKGDVYSFGVILLELLTGKFVEKTGLDLPRWVRSIVREEWTGEVFDKEISDVEMYAFPLLNVSLKCVALNADERPTVAEVLEKVEEVVTAQED